jgi:ribonuclease P protein component
MRRSTDFSSAVRRGRRVRRGSIVVHFVAPTSASAADPGDVDAAQVGFVVGKSVGGSVVRHRVSRRLRAIMASRLAELPAGSATVVRAMPGAGQATSAQLTEDVDGALARVPA